MKHQKPNRSIFTNHLQRGIFSLLIAGLFLTSSLSAQTNSDAKYYSVNFQPVGTPAPDYIDNFSNIHKALDVVYKAGYSGTDHVYVDVYPGVYDVNGDKSSTFNKIYYENGAFRFSRIKLFTGENTPFVHLRYVGDEHQEALIVSTDVWSPFWIAKGSVEGFRVIYIETTPPEKGEDSTDDNNGTNKGISITGSVKVIDCKVEGFQIGIVGFCASNFSNSAEAQVLNCEVYGNDSGLATGEMNVYFQNNYMHHNEIGFTFGPGGSPFFTDNLIEHNDVGIFIKAYHAWAVYAVVQNNLIRYNKSGIQANHYGWQDDPQHPGERRVAMPICSVIQNNIIVNFEDTGIECFPIEEGSQPQPGELLFSYMPFLRNNDVFAKLGSVFYSNCPSVFDSISANPKIDYLGYLMDESPCIDAGSYLLDPGYATEYMDHDRGQIDLGYHHNERVTLPEFSGREWIVDQDCREPFHFASIQGALESEYVKDEDIIQVRQTKSPYRENIRIQKSIMLTAERSGENYRPVISAVNGSPAIIVEQSIKRACINNLAVIAQFMHTRPGPGIQIQAYCTVSNCLISQHTNGIVVDTPENGNIQYCTINDCSSNGIYISGGYNGRIFSNWIEANRLDGIHVISDSFSETKPIIESNTIYTCGDNGIDVEYFAASEDMGIAIQLFNNVVFDNASYGFESNRMYTELKGQTGIFPHMRNNNFYNNNCDENASEEDKISPYNNFHHGPYFKWEDDDGNIHVDCHWYCPYPPNGERHSCRMFNPMSFNPLYYLPHRLLSDRSKCIDAGCYNLDPGYSQASGPDAARIDMGMHTP